MRSELNRRNHPSLTSLHQFVDIPCFRIYDSWYQRRFGAFNAPALLPKGQIGSGSGFWGLSFLWASDLPLALNFLTLLFLHEAECNFKERLITGSSQLRRDLRGWPGPVLSRSLAIDYSTLPGRADLCILCQRTTARCCERSSGIWKESLPEQISGPKMRRQFCTSLSITTTEKYGSWLSNRVTSRTLSIVSFRKSH